MAHTAGARINKSRDSTAGAGHIMLAWCQVDRQRNLPSRWCRSCAAQWRSCDQLCHGWPGCHHAQQGAGSSRGLRAKAKWNLEINDPWRSCDWRVAGPSHSLQTEAMKAGDYTGNPPACTKERPKSQC
eukprot:1148169-Pelagomonas_calceolata.AAC.14